MNAVPGSTANIRDIPDRKARFAHVAKHLYARRERWDLTVSGLPRDPRGLAVANGCERQSIQGEAPSWYDACKACQEHVLADHDRFYQPAYRSALSSAAVAGRRGHLDTNSEALVGDNGVFTIVKESRDHGLHVASAYRVVPKGIAPGQAKAQDFFREAERKLRDKTDYGEGT
ncbi:hypothetical protein WMF04_46575 [Sorangium sp. So ce260]|uniref:hypothetical protein n=1 Tax=Sorangium sp. So ce260 TaxID=3133291 RepID=UPI003F6089A5